MIRLQIYVHDTEKLFNAATIPQYKAMERNHKRLAIAIIGVAVTISAMIALPVISVFAIPPSYTTVTSSSAIPTAGNAIAFQVITAGPTAIPHVPDSYIQSVAVFGYAWLLGTSPPINVVVAAIHPTFTDSTQNPRIWHPHTATLVTDSTCSSVTGSVSSLKVTSLASPEGGLSIAGNTLTLTLQKTDVPSGTFSGATGFQIIPVTVGTTTKLCVAAP